MSYARWLFGSSANDGEMGPFAPGEHTQHPRCSLKHAYFMREDSLPPGLLFVRCRVSPGATRWTLSESENQRCRESVRDFMRADSLA
jgi:hypothetical protein